MIPDTHNGNDREVSSTVRRYLLAGALTCKWLRLKQQDGDIYLALSQWNMEAGRTEWI